MKDKTVLVVDDEEDLTWSIGKHLEKDREYYRHMTCNSGAEALDILARHPIDMVITDIRMPEISGLDLLLKIGELYPHIKVIIMTAYGNSEVQEQANERGCFRYIEKPFEIRELRELIRDTLEEKKGFRGSLEDFQLSDLIQMNCLGRLSNSIRVTSGAREGIIFFEDGNIIHAQLGDLVGEEAFYEIISWPGGKFTLNKSLRADRESILKGWQSLLLEGLRRKDEANNSEISEDKARKEMQEVVDGLVRTKGVRLAVFFKPDGSAFVQARSESCTGEYDLVAVSVKLHDFLNQGDELMETFRIRGRKEYSMEFQNGLLKLTWMPETQSYLMLLADQSSNFGLLRIESKKYLRSVADIIRKYGLFRTGQKPA